MGPGTTTPLLYFLFRFFRNLPSAKPEGPRPTQRHAALYLGFVYQLLHNGVSNAKHVIEDNGGKVFPYFNEVKWTVDEGGWIRFSVCEHYLFHKPSIDSLLNPESTECSP